MVSGPARGGGSREGACESTVRRLLRLPLSGGGVPPLREVARAG